MAEGLMACKSQPKWSGRHWWRDMILAIYYIYLYDLIYVRCTSILFKYWSYSIHSGCSWWYANHIPSLMIESVIALFLMPEHPLQWMIHSDTKAISSTFDKISLSFPASPKDVVGLRSNALITSNVPNSSKSPEAFSPSTGDPMISNVSSPDIPSFF